MKKYEIDYYVTVQKSNGDFDDYDIIKKISTKAILSNDDLENDLEILIKKQDIDPVPSKNDLIFFKNLKFYSVLDCQEDGDFYIVNISKYKIKK